MDLENVNYKKSVLPYATEDTNRKDKPFTPEMEIAAITCLAEGQRKKSRLLGGPSKILFLSKMHYPFWTVPGGDRCIIIDGSGFLVRKDKYSRLPDISRFTEDLKRNSIVKEEFLNTLKKHAKTFKDFAATVDVLLNSVIVNKEVLHAFLEYLKQGNPIDENTEPVTIPRVLKKEDALERGEKLIQHWRQIQADIKGFQYAVEVLNEGTDLNERGISREIEQLDERYTNEISKLKPIVEKKIKELIRKRESEIAKITKAAEKKLKTATREKEKHERKIQTLERSSVLLRKKVEASKRKRDESKVARWSYELKRCQREIDKVDMEIKAVSRFIERTRKETESAIKELEERHRMAIEQEEARVTDLTALRDSEITAKQKTLEELLLESSHLENLIEKLAERKRLHALKLEEETTVPWKQDEITLVYLPFYLVKYEKEEAEPRYGVYPPAFATDYKGISMTVQKALRSFSLESRVNLLLRSRSKDLSEMLDSVLLKRMKEDKDFEEKMGKIGCLNNLFSSTEFRQALTRGLEELRAEGWVNPAETQTIIKEYGGI